MSRNTSTTPATSPLLVADRGGTVVNGSFRAVLGDEQAVVRQPDDHAFPQGSDGGTLDRLAALFVDDAEHAVERLARRFFQRPAGQGLSDRVQEGDPPLVSVVITASPMLASVTRHHSGWKCNASLLAGEGSVIPPSI